MYNPAAPTMASWPLIFSALMLFFTCILPGVESLQCYYCSGVTDYDPNNCFDPRIDDGSHTAHTLTQECKKGDWCEKKVFVINAWQEKISRGCSSNCAGRDYIWTEDYRVYCCSKEDLCNSATHHSLPISTLVLTTLMAAALYFYNTR